VSDLARGAAERDVGDRRPAPAGPGSKTWWAPIRESTC